MYRPWTHGKVRFFCFRLEIPLLGKFGPKNQNCHFKLKIGTNNNSNMQSSVVMLTFSIFNMKYPFWAYLAQKTKNVSLSWNFVPRPMQVCRIKWCLLFVFFVIDLSKFGPKKKKKCQFKLKFVTLSRLIQVCRMVFIFLCYQLEILFLG